MFASFGSRKGSVMCVLAPKLALFNKENIVWADDLLFSCSPQTYRDQISLETDLWVDMLNSKSVLCKTKIYCHIEQHRPSPKHMNSLEGYNLLRKEESLLLLFV